MSKNGPKVVKSKPAGGEVKTRKATPFKLKLLTRLTYLGKSLDRLARYAERNNRTDLADAITPILAAVNGGMPVFNGLPDDFRPSVSVVRGNLLTAFAVGDTVKLSPEAVNDPANQAEGFGPDTRGTISRIWKAGDFAKAPLMAACTLPDGRTKVWRLNTLARA